MCTTIKAWIVDQLRHIYMYIYMHMYVQYRS